VVPLGEFVLQVIPVGEFYTMVQGRQHFNKVVIKQKSIMIICSNFKIDAAKFI
jgi:hypothetical protein